MDRRRWIQGYRESHHARRRFVAALGLIAIAISLGLLWLDQRKPVVTLSAGSETAELPGSADGIDSRSVLDGPGLDQQTRTAAVASYSPTTDSEQDLGVLHLLSPAQRAPAVGSRWSLHRLESAGAEATLVADPQGRVLVEPGLWSLHALDDEWTSPSGTVLVEPGSEQVVWVQRAVNRRFRVLDQSDTPIKGVMAVWEPRTLEGVGGGLPKDLDVRRSTDSSGVVTFESGPFENGTVTFIHPTYARVRLSLCGPPEAEVRVQLTPAGSGRLLRFLPSRGGRQFESIAISSTDGLELARSRAQSDTVELPAWIPPTEILRVSAPGVFPCQFRLGNIEADTLVLPMVVVVPFLVEDRTGCDGAAIRIRPTEASLASALEPWVASTATSCRPGEEVLLELPDGYELEARATNGCGALDTTSFVVNDVPSPIQLALGAPGQLVLAVRDESGSPLPSASARVSGFETFQADATGTVRVPMSPATRTIHVTAEGHCAAILSRSESEPGPATLDEHTTITLERSSRVSVVVRSIHGRPLAGMRVRVWPSVPSDSLQHGEVWSEGRVSAALVSTTDSQGQCSPTGIRAGVAQVEVDLPPMLGTDAWQQSAYPPIRFERALNDGAVVEVEVPEPVQLTLQVEDATTGRLVDGFTLVGQAATVPPVEAAGGYWQGWVSSSVTRFLVAVDGLGSTEFTRNHVAQQERHVLRVAPASATRLRITGEPSLAVGTRLSVQVMEKSVEGLHAVSSLQATLDERSEAWIDLGPWQDAWVAIAPIVHEDGRIRFDPEAQPAGQGAVLEYRPVLRD